jgi:phage tail protein X
VAVYEGSRYVTTKLKRFGRAVPLIDIRLPVLFDPDKCDTYTVRKGDRVDGIAYQKYGRADLYWAILDANPQYFSELDITVGDVLLLPKFREVVRVARV